VPRRTPQVLLSVGAIAVVVLLLGSAGVASHAAPVAVARSPQHPGTTLTIHSLAGSPVAPNTERRLAPRTGFSSEAPTWVPIEATPAPPTEVGAAMAYDYSLGETVLFGGHLPPPFSNEENYTWAYADGAWTNLTGAAGVAPPASSGASLVYDPSTQSLILFGGVDPSGACLNATWSFDGSWTNITPTLSPSARQWAAMTWDSHADGVVLFGGEAENGSFLNDTWTFSGGAWSLGSPTHAPSVRAFAGFVDDPALGGAVLFGGRTGTYTTPDNDTELFEGGNWSPISTPDSPVGRANPEMALDANTGDIVLFGGYNGSSGNTYYDDTWTFNGTHWTPVLVSGILPAARGAGGFAYDGADAYVVMFGGAGSSSDLGDTWVLDLLSGFFVTLSPTNGSAPFNVSVSGSASYGPMPYTYDWNWGDGTSSLGESTRHMYVSDGVYSVTLNVTDALGAYLHAGPTTVSVSGPLAVKISSNVTGGVAPLSVAFSSFAWGGYAPYRDAWTFGDGGTSASLAPVRVYRSAGTFPVTLNVTDLNGTRVVAYRNVTVTVMALQATASATPEVGSAPLTVAFQANATGGTPPYNYSWAFGDGGMAFGDAPSHTYVSPGNFTAALTIRDADSWEVDRGFPIDVEAPPLRSTIQATPVGIGTLEVHFAATTTGGIPPYSYLWSIGSPDRSSTPEFNLTFAGPGTYAVELATSDHRGTIAYTFANVTVSAPGSGTASSCTGLFGACGFAEDELLIGFVVAVLVVVALVVLFARRRRSDPPGPPPTLTPPPPSPGPAAAVNVPPSTAAPSGPVAPLTSAEVAAVAAVRSEPSDGAAGSISDRLLVRLYDLGRPDPNAPVPDGFTQDGLAAALGTVQSGIARSLLRLEEAGMIASEVAHVPNRVRRVKVYRLSPRGESEVRRRTGR
jgi:PKD repeat protein